MQSLFIQGGNPLRGRIRVSGSKYSALAALPATLLADSPTVLENVPDIADVRIYIDILNGIGAKAERLGPGVVRVDPRGVNRHEVPYELARSMRASYYLLPVLTVRAGEAEVSFPGGDDIGPRPIDLHLMGFRRLGMEVRVEHGAILTRSGPGGPRGASIYLDMISVGATINMMLAAVLATGVTTIIGCDRGPHIVNVADLLNSMGAQVQGAGTDTIRVFGLGPRGRLSGCHHSLIPDLSEAATFMAAAVATCGEVVVEGVVPRHVEAMTLKLREAGATVLENGDSVAVRGTGRLRAISKVKTGPYPTFFTDFQPPLTALLTTADGTSMVVETVWMGRLRYIAELQALGANVQVTNNTAVIQGVPALSGARVTAGDLRAGAALTIAGLMAEGRTEVRGIEHADRGYERFDEKLRGLGALVSREA